MESLLSSFAISVAANILTSFFANNNTEKEIRSAFQEAIEECFPNEDIRGYRELEISRFVESYISNPNLVSETLTNREAVDLIKRLADDGIAFVTLHLTASVSLYNHAKATRKIRARYQ